ncbi:MAG: DUF333 domain-containing protein [Candidatus Marinimicrobia bacterium]|nr:DUF333 domain-containing protein [Candidatus Neomarinimicrobiota bacterium]
MKKIKLLFLIAIFVTSVGLVYADDEVVGTTAETQAVLTEDNVGADDFGVEDPSVLPDSPVYFLIGWSRGIGNFFTFNPVKKAERYWEQANEKLIEAKKVAEKTGNEQISLNAMERYEKAVEKAKERMENIENKKDNRFQTLMDKFTEDSLTQSRLLNNLRERNENIPEGVRDRAELLRERAEERIGDVLGRAASTTVAERLERIFEKRQEEGKAVNTSQVEALKRVQERLRENLPEASGAGATIERVIEKQEERIREREHILEQQTTNTTGTQNSVRAGMANPASTYCVEKGGKLEIKTNEKGEYGICNLPDGRRCEEWSFFRGTCGATNNALKVQSTSGQNSISQ